MNEGPSWTTSVAIEHDHYYLGLPADVGSPSAAVGRVHGGAMIGTLGSPLNVHLRLRLATKDMSSPRSELRQEFVLDLGACAEILTWDLVPLRDEPAEVLGPGVWHILVDKTVGPSPNEEAHVITAIPLDASATEWYGQRSRGLDERGQQEVQTEFRVYEAHPQAGLFILTCAKLGTALPRPEVGGLLSWSADDLVLTHGGRGTWTITVDPDAGFRSGTTWVSIVDKLQVTAPIRIEPVLRSGARGTLDLPNPLIAEGVFLLSIASPSDEALASGTFEPEDLEIYFGPCVE